MLNSAHGIKLQELATGTRFEPVLALLAMRSAEELDWSAKVCFAWYHHVYRAGLVQDVPAYQLHGQESAESIPVCRAGVKKWTKDRAAKELKRYEQRPAIQSERVVRESDNAEDALVRIPVSVQGVPVGRERQLGPSHIVSSGDLPVPELKTAVRNL